MSGKFSWILMFAYVTSFHLCDDCSLNLIVHPTLISQPQVRELAEKESDDGVFIMHPRDILGF